MARFGVDVPAYITVWIDAESEVEAHQRLHNLPESFVFDVAVEVTGYDLRLAECGTAWTKGKHGLPALTSGDLFNND